MADRSGHRMMRAAGPFDVHQVPDLERSWISFAQMVANNSLILQSQTISLVAD